MITINKWKRLGKDLNESEPNQSDAEKAMLAWLAKADELMKDNEYWLHPYVYDQELEELLWKRRQQK